MSQTERVTAAILVIGDEILSGRTQDTNTDYIAKFLGALGIDLCEARVVPDIQDEIVAALNALRARYTYVFTTGGIGPTHDDITFEAVAAAFGVGVYYHPEAMAAMAARYKPGEFNEARKRMALIPVGRGTGAQQRVDRAGRAYRQCLRHGRCADDHARDDGRDRTAPEARRRRPCRDRAGESSRRAHRRRLGKIQSDHKDVAIGSYPFYREDGSGVQLVARGRDADEVETAAREIEALLRESGRKSPRGTALNHIWRSGPGLPDIKHDKAAGLV